MDTGLEFAGTDPVDLRRSTTLTVLHCLGGESLLAHIRERFAPIFAIGRLSSCVPGGMSLTIAVAGEVDHRRIVQLALPPPRLGGIAARLLVKRFSGLACYPVQSIESGSAKTGAARVTEPERWPSG